MSLVVDFGRALAQIGDPRFRSVLWKSIGLTLLALAAVFWAAMLLLGWLLPETVTLPWIGEVDFVDDLVSWAAVGLMLVLSVVLMVPATAAVVGFFLDDVAEATREVSRVLDDSDVMGEHPYTLEVTSRGVDRPLTLPRHWRRNTERLVKVTTASGEVLTGRIVDCDDHVARLDVSGQQREVAYAEVSKAMVQVEFNRPEAKEA